MEAFLSDNSAPGYTNTALANLMGNGESGVYSISYAAESAGQTLTIKWTLSQGTRGDANVTLQAAALTAPGANNPPAVSITGPADGANFSANDDISVTADAADADGTIARVEFFQNDAQLGESTRSWRRRPGR